MYKKITKKMYEEALLDYTESYNYGFFITVNSNSIGFNKKIKYSDYYMFGKDIKLISHSLNVYCYGKQGFRTRIA